MTTFEEPAALPPHKDEERLAYHEAARAVVMWGLGRHIGSITIDPDGRTPGVISALSYDPNAPGVARDRRYIVERNAMVLHAASVAELFLHPGIKDPRLSCDHDELHRELYAIEEEESVQVTWCDYLWQRTYWLIASPWRWRLLLALARFLRAHRTLSGRSAEFFLKRVGAVIDYHCMADFQDIDEVTCVCSPWHRAWHSESVDRTPAAMPMELLEAVEQMDLKEIRPLRSVIGPLSARAQRVLDLCNIRTVLDLSLWSKRELSSIRGAGRMTVQEIVDAAAKAGVTIAPHGHPDQERSPYSLAGPL